MHKNQRRQNIALVSDAGTPGISDPGFLLLRVSETRIEIECLPVLQHSFLIGQFWYSCDRFYFEGSSGKKAGNLD